MNIHSETFMQIAELGTRIPEYRPTFDFEGAFIDDSHRFFSECPVKDGILVQMRNRRRFNAVIKGFLRREDALKLYEMAYFAQGDILELGAFQGLSTCILSRANHNSPCRKRIVTVDLGFMPVLQTTINLGTMGLKGDVTVMRAEAVAAIRRLARDNRQFGFVFVDHSHAYDPVFGVCRELRSVVAKGGFCLFHDFNDIRNRDPLDRDYGVYQAVVEGLDPAAFEFCGIYGCCALYRAK